MTNCTCLLQSDFALQAGSLLFLVSLVSGREKRKAAFRPARTFQINPEALFDSADFGTVDKVGRTEIRFPFPCNGET